MKTEDLYKELSKIADQMESFVDEPSIMDELKKDYILTLQKIKDKENEKL